MKTSKVQTPKQSTMKHKIHKNALGLFCLENHFSAMPLYLIVGSFYPGL